MFVDMDKASLKCAHNSYNNFKTGKCSERSRSTQLYGLGRSCCSQDCVILMREQTHSSVEQSRDTGNRPTQICLIMIFDTDAKAIQWRKTVDSTLHFWNKWVSSERRERQMIETRDREDLQPKGHILYKNYLKMDP